MFDISFWELFLIGIVALVILGPERLPGAIKSTVSTIRSVKNMASGFKSEVEEQLRVHELHENLKKAEELGLDNVSPEVAKSVEELKQAALSVQEPYKKNKDDKQHD
ncbi:Sec-independent protein translocase subunit TatB [Glaciecola sp. MH2013]|uniref:Sec-independent protein translocase protein TatB n=1 Tax=Glaciecola sp. MH2013 TaxID=2785524 RepID=UPI00189F8ECF|nr:Sec-independent protein translocase protein TatB [Glaciecola sp. MH2013]MBF7073817.1 Sec-independent protein translocase subunit TatB [Glaciecola sp. MH2013]